MTGVVKEILKIRHFAPKNAPVNGDTNIPADIGKMQAEANMAGTKAYGATVAGN